MGSAASPLRPSAASLGSVRSRWHVSEPPRHVRRPQTELPYRIRRCLETRCTCEPIGASSGQGWPSDPAGGGWRRGVRAASGSVPRIGQGVSWLVEASRRPGRIRNRRGERRIDCYWRLIDNPRCRTRKKRISKGTVVSQCKGIIRLPNKKWI